MSTCTLNHSALESRGFDAPPMAALALSVPVTPLVQPTRDRFLDRDVALKLLTPRYLGRAEREQRFLNEAEYLRRVQDHSHVTRVIDSGRLRDRHQWPWMSTEIMSGKTLDRLKLHRTLEIQETLEIARQLAEALRACHEAGVVHRDLTPNNVFVLDDGSVKLFDFSHAADLRGPKLAVGAAERLTRIWETPGTVGYIAPEQAANSAPDACMDVYSYGVLLYEVVARSHPFKRYTDRDEFIQAQVAGTIETPRLQAWAYDAPEELAELVRDCMQRLGSKRPTMSEVLARLEAIIGVMAETASAEGEIRIPPLTAANEDVTTAMDVPTIIAAQRGQTQVDPKVIGAWNDPDQDPDARIVLTGAEAAAARDEGLAIKREIAAAREAAALPDEAEERTEVVPLASAPRERDPAPPEPEVPVDAAAMFAARRGRPKADPKMIGAWNVPAVAREPEPAERTEVVPLAPAPPVPPEPAPPEPECELAFARPPHLRKATVMPSTVMVGEELAGPSEVQQVDSCPSGGIDPGYSSATEAAEPDEDEDLAPIGRPWGKIVGLVAGVGLVVMLLSWGAYAQFFGPEEKNDDERDQSAAIRNDPDAEAEAEPAGPVPDGETGADDSDSVVETGGIEIVPEVEPVEVDPQPKPKNGKPHNGKPKNGSPTNGEPNNREPKNGKPANGESETSKDPVGDSGSHKSKCEGVEPEARSAAESLDWAEVVKLTARSGCWSSSKERTLLRVRALTEMGRWDDCLKAAEGSNDPRVQRHAENCRKFSK